VFSLKFLPTAGDKKDYEVHKNVNHGNDKMSRIEEFCMIRIFESNQIKCSAKCKKANRTKQFKTTANNTYPNPKLLKYSQFPESSLLDLS
jgi:hypothetical protein